MEFTYTLTEEDYLQFNMSHVKNSKSVHKSLIIQRYAVPVAYILLAIIMSGLLDIPLVWLLVPFIVMSIIWILAYPTIFYNSVRRNAKKMIKEGKNDNLLGQHYMQISNQGLTDRHANGETTVNWTGIEKVVQDNYYIFLYNSSISAYIIPKRELEGQLEAFITMIHEKVK